MKTLKCKNCGGEIERRDGEGQTTYAHDGLSLTIGCPHCRQNIVYGLGEVIQYSVDVVATNDDVEDEINKPSHYHKGGIDVIGYAEKKFSAEERKGFYRISALKYITRFEDKGQPLKDLNKAKFYVDKLIELQEGSE